MDHYAGIDVSLELSSVCVVDAQGRIVKEAKVASDPDALVAWFKEVGLAMVRIGLEAGPLYQWLHAGLTRAGFAVMLLETRHVKAALSAMTVKTDRKDALGIAQLIRMDGSAGACQIDWIAGGLKAGEGRLGAQDRSDPAPHLGRRHNLPVECRADRDTGLIKEEYETQVGQTAALMPKSRRRDGGTGEAVTRPVAVIRRTTRIR